MPNRDGTQKYYMPKKASDLHGRVLCSFAVLYFSLPLAVAGLWLHGTGCLVLLGVALAVCWLRDGRPSLSSTVAGALSFCLRVAMMLMVALLFLAAFLTASAEEGVIRSQVTAWAKRVYETPTELGIEITVTMVTFLLLLAFLGATQWLWLPAWRAADYPHSMIVRLVQHFFSEQVEDHADSVPLPPVTYFKGCVTSDEAPVHLAWPQGQTTAPA